jgi:hypothetical protein
VPGTDDADSTQIIIPQNQVGRKNGEGSRSRLSGGAIANVKSPPI